MIPDEIRDALAPHWNDYIPWSPSPRQLAFLMLNPYREVLFGGAAGGGKSGSLLMAALQFVDVPEYSAVILRMQRADFQKPNSILHRAFQLLAGTDAIWQPEPHRFLFPQTGATLDFGYIGESSAEQRYQGAEYQFIGFDEVQQQYEDDYLFMFSRLRKLVCPIHRVDDAGAPQYEDGCKICQVRKMVPLRVRATANPPRAGERGSTWVRERFRIVKVGEQYRGTHPDRPHVPSFLEDNPYIDQASYRESLNELDPVTREQLLRGDWGVSKDGRFRKSWMRYFSFKSGFLHLGPAGKGKLYRDNECRRWMIVDPAASEREGPGDTDRYRGGPSYTVIGTFDVTPCWNACWRHMTRGRWEIPEVIDRIVGDYREWQPEYIGVEYTTANLGVYQTLKNKGLPVRELSPRVAGGNVPGSAKMIRSTDAAIRMEQGKIWLPDDQVNCPWVADVEKELFTWTGHPHETADIVDVLSYASMEVSREASSFENWQDNGSGFVTSRF